MSPITPIQKLESHPGKLSGNGVTATIKSNMSFDGTHDFVSLGTEKGRMPKFAILGL